MVHSEKIANVTLLSLQLPTKTGPRLSQLYPGHHTITLTTVHHGWVFDLHKSLLTLNYDMVHSVQIHNNFIANVPLLSLQLPTTTTTPLLSSPHYPLHPTISLTTLNLDEYTNTRETSCRINPKREEN